MFAVLVAVFLLIPALRFCQNASLSEEDLNLCNVRRFSRTKTSATITTAMNSTGSLFLPNCSGDRTLLLGPGTWTITADLTIPSRFITKIPRGTLITVHGGVTLTLNHIEAGNYGTSAD